MTKRFIYKAIWLAGSALVVILLAVLLFKSGFRSGLQTIPPQQREVSGPGLYRNAKYGFSFELPSSVSVTPGSGVDHDARTIFNVPGGTICVSVGIDVLWPCWQDAAGHPLFTGEGGLKDNPPAYSLKLGDEFEQTLVRLVPSSSTNADSELMMSYDDLSTNLSVMVTLHKRSATEISDFATELETVKAVLESFNVR